MTRTCFIFSPKTWNFQQRVHGGKISRDIITVIKLKGINEYWNRNRLMSNREQQILRCPLKPIVTFKRLKTASSEATLPNPIKRLFVATLKHNEQRFLPKTGESPN